MFRPGEIPRLHNRAGHAWALHGQSQDVPRFRGGIDLVSVTATVTDGDGRFVADLRKEDFSVYEDGTHQTLTQFTREPVPVSVASCSMPAAA